MREEISWSLVVGLRPRFLVLEAEEGTGGDAGSMPAPVRFARLLAGRGDWAAWVDTEAAAAATAAEGAGRDEGRALLFVLAVVLVLVDLPEPAVERRLRGRPEELPVEAGGGVYS